MNDSPAERPSDDTGLLFVYQIDSNGSGTELQSNVGMPHASADAGGYRWFHLQIDTPGAAEWMQQQQFDPELIDVLTAVETRPRTLVVPDGVVAVLRGINLNPGADPDDMVSVRVLITGNLVVSTQREQRGLQSINELCVAIGKSKGPKSPAEWLITLVDHLADRIGIVVDNIDEELTQFETGRSDERPTDLRRSLSVSRRQTASIRRFLAPQREALDRLFRTPDVFSDREGYELHRQTDRMIRHLEELDLARERALVLQEDLQNRIAEEQNSRVYLLSIVAAIFLPLSFLTGVFGMNVAGLPGLDNPTAFILLTICMLILAAGIIGFMRWRKWL